MNEVERSRAARVVTWLIAGLVVVLLLKLVLALLRITIGLVAFVLFVAVPLIVVGWLALRIWDRLDRGRATGP